MSISQLKNVTQHINSLATKRLPLSLKDLLTQ